MGDPTISGLKTTGRHSAGAFDALSQRQLSKTWNCTAPTEPRLKFQASFWPFLAVETEVSTQRCHIPTVSTASEFRVTCSPGSRIEPIARPSKGAHARRLSSNTAQQDVAEAVPVLRLTSLQLHASKLFRVKYQRPFEAERQCYHEH